MKERRSLVEGIADVTPEQQAREESFVFGNNKPDAKVESAKTLAATDEQPVPVPTTAAPAQPARQVSHYAGRVPMTARTRPEVASAIKRAALTRQLEGVVPFSVQDIVEEALELWLHTNGYRID